MVFSSPIFLFLFLPVVFWFNYVIKEEYSNLCLVIASIFFYAWGEPYFVLLMILSITVNWLLGKAIVTRPAFQKMFLAVGMAFNFGLLGYYKYAGFLLGIFNSLLGKDIFALPKARLPIGISFFTFQAVSYLADLYRGETKRHGSLIHTALYISFFPQLIAGPIVKYKDIDSQIASRSITSDGIAAGFRRFIYGLAKKVFVANVLGKSADAVFAMDVLSIGGKTAWMASLLYTFQIYYDFSGYSDMAIGMGRMFGFQIPENFNYPYLSTSIQEFWRRWHISLGAWFRDYVYIPLGGNHKGGGKTCVNLLVVFFLTGLWHGAGFSFLVWGLYHGLLLVWERIQLKRILHKAGWLSHIYLFLAVNFGWVIFRCESLKQGLFFLKRMIMPWLYTKYDRPVWEYMDIFAMFIFGCAFLGMGVFQSIVPQSIRRRFYDTGLECVYCAILLIFCIAAIASGTYHPFIYFQF